MTLSQRFFWILTAMTAPAALLSLTSAGFAQENAATPPMTLEDAVAGGEAIGVMHEKHILKFAVAERIGEAFFACGVRKNKPRSLHIVDQFGTTIYAARMDGQIADNIDVARMKAEAALYFRENTGVWLKRAEDDPLLALWLSQLGQFTSPVGLPIIVENQLLGAIGIGGASGDCAHEALEEVLGPQPPLVSVAD